MKLASTYILNSCPHAAPSYQEIKSPHVFLSFLEFPLQWMRPPRWLHFKSFGPQRNFGAGRPVGLLSLWPRFYDDIPPHSTRRKIWKSRVIIFWVLSYPILTWRVIIWCETFNRFISELQSEDGHLLLLLCSHPQDYGFIVTNDSHEYAPWTRKNI